MQETTAAAEPELVLPRRLVYVPLQNIRPAANNGERVHDLPAIRKAIRRLGFNDPLKDDTRTGRLVGGHGAVEALVAMLEDAEPAPDGILVDDDGSWLVPVFTGWASRNSAEASAQNVAFNQLPENGRYSDRGLVSLLEDVATGDADLLDVTGFDADALDGLFRLVDPERIGDADPDDPFTDPKAKDDAPAAEDTAGTPDVLDSDRKPMIRCPECDFEFRPGDTSSLPEQG